MNAVTPLVVIVPSCDGSARGSSIRGRPRSKLRLTAEMRLPGRAWLEFEVTPTANGSTVRRTAIFDRVGLGGLAYWYALYPVHRLVFAKGSSRRQRPCRLANRY
jgi:hypothetical protein